jgi:hypothetical protein
MQADQLNHNESVTPVEYNDVEGKTFMLRHLLRDDDLIAQVFLKDVPSLEGESPLQLGGRVAKAVVDTLGEDAMHRVKIEAHDDPMLGGTSIYVNMRDRGTEIMANMIIPRLAKHLEVCLEATRV